MPASFLRLSCLGAAAVLVGALLLLIGCESDGGVLPGGKDAAGTVADARVDGSSAEDAIQGGGGPDGAETDASSTDAAATHDAGATDAGGFDAPPLCTPMGACSPFVLASCGAQQACRAESAGTLCLALPPTPLPEGAACLGTYECGAGFTCVGVGGQPPKCTKLCPANQVGFCGPGQACSVALSGDACLKLCAPLPAACDIYSAQSCPDANTKCDLSVHPETSARYTACVAAGEGGIGATCTGGSRCARGLVCINVGAEGARCRQVCDARVANPVCSVSGQSCTGRSSLYGVTFCL